MNDSAWAGTAPKSSAPVAVAAARPPPISFFIVLDFFSLALFAEVSGWPSVSSIPQRLVPRQRARTPPEVTRRDGSLVNRHDGLVGVVFLVCLARVVLVGGVDRPHDVFATGAFAGDDENVVHLTVLSALVGLWAEPRDRVDDDGVRGSGGQLGVHHRL